MPQRPLNATPLFLVMLSVVTTQVMGTDHTYWAFIPNPAINLVESWGVMNIPMMVSESSWLPGPYDNRGPAQPMEEGKEIKNYTVGVQVPICMRNGIQCLNIIFQVQLSIINTTQDYHIKF